MLMDDDSTALESAMEQYCKLMCPLTKELGVCGAVVADYATALYPRGQIELGISRAVCYKHWHSDIGLLVCTKDCKAWYNLLARQGAVTLMHFLSFVSVFSVPKILSQVYPQLFY